MASSGIGECDLLTNMKLVSVYVCVGARSKVPGDHLSCRSLLVPRNSQIMALLYKLPLVTKKEHVEAPSDASTSGL